MALLGASGVGKSTLINALVGGGDLLRTSEVRENDGRGRHTTTACELVRLPGGEHGWLIDTPGVRAVSLWSSGTGIERAFADVFDLSERCRFRDCKHEDEPGLCGHRCDRRRHPRSASPRRDEAPRRRGARARGGAAGLGEGAGQARDAQAAAAAVGRRGLIRESIGDSIGRSRSGRSTCRRPRFSAWTSPSPPAPRSTASCCSPSWTSGCTRTRRVYEHQTRRGGQPQRPAADHGGDEGRGEAPRPVEPVPSRSRMGAGPVERRVRAARRDHGSQHHRERGLQLLRARHRQHGGAHPLRHARAAGHVAAPVARGPRSARRSR